MGRAMKPAAALIVNVASVSFVFNVSSVTFLVEVALATFDVIASRGARPGAAAPLP